MNFKKIYKTLGKDEELPMFPIETKCMEAIKVRSSSWSRLYATLKRLCLIVYCRACSSSGAGELGQTDRED